jgi:hypothetical protein
VPGRYNFIQASIYRVKLTDIPGRPGLELYPSIEVVPANAKTEAFLAHNYVPVSFTNEDLDQIVAGNYLTKVIYLPDAQYQGPTATMPDEIVSTRLEPGADPIAEAVKRGHILAVIRVGGIDLEAANTPGLENQGPYGQPKPNTGGAGQHHGGHGAAPMPQQGPNVLPVALQSQQRPTLPGVAAAVPTGMPGTPPVVTPPSGPVVNVPAPPKMGPMVPAPNGSLPPMPVAGMPSTYKGGEVQQTTYVLGTDGQRRPFPFAGKKETGSYPMTAIPAGKGGQEPVIPEMSEDKPEEPIAPVAPSKQRAARKGLLETLWPSSDK